MAWHRVRTFFRHSFTPGEYLGLHLTVGLLLTLAALWVFIAIMRGVHEEYSGLQQLDLHVAKEMEFHADGHPALLHTLRAVTVAGGVPAIVLLTVAGFVVLLVRKRFVLATVWVLAAGGGGLFDLIIKQAIGRERPINPDAVVTETNGSFPSGHAMGSVVGYGMLGYLLVLHQRRRRLRLVIIAGLTALVLLIGLSRVYLRAHYFSDVLGGFCIGTVWLTVCVTGLEGYRLKRARLRRAGDPAAPGTPHLPHDVPMESR
jgi:undecaprenyl-diphosphatase